MPAEETTAPTGQKAMRVLPGGNVGLCTDGYAHCFHKDYTLAGICVAIVCFPCGLYCCWSLSGEKCIKCQYVIER
jgi:hypothetical protein